ncbi:MAG: hypothetical protein KGJ77_06945 [Acidobacteriota bacterium]|nr:hypothetical protein [Acidobacteriota bacterium]
MHPPTRLLPLRGSAKGGGSWFAVTDASVYVDHPVHAPDLHTVNVDLRNPALGPSARLALELDAASARALAEAIVATLATTPPGVLDEPAGHPTPTAGS